MTDQVIAPPAPLSEQEMDVLREDYKQRHLDMLRTTPIRMDARKRKLWLRRRNKEIKDLKWLPCRTTRRMDKNMVIRRRGELPNAFHNMFRTHRRQNAPKGWEIVYLTKYGSPYDENGFLKKPFNTMPIF